MFQVNSNNNHKLALKSSFAEAGWRFMETTCGVEVSNEAIIRVFFSPMQSLQTNVLIVVQQPDSDFEIYQRTFNMNESWSLEGEALDWINKQLIGFYERKFIGEKLNMYEQVIISQFVLNKIQNMETFGNGEIEVGYAGELYKLNWIVFGGSLVIIVSE